MKSMRYILSKYLPQPFRSVYYKHIYKRHKDEYLFDAEQFSGKKVLVIGPAETVRREIGEIQLKDYDLIIKMNNGIHTPLAELGDDALRCDILFHSLTDDTKKISASGLLESGVKTLVHRTPKKSAFLRTLLAEEDFGKHLAVKILPCEEYDRLTKRLDGYSPSTGLMCLDYFLASPADEIAAVGFTFFTSKYINGYDDQVKTDRDMVERISVDGHHNSDKEALLVGDLISIAIQSGKKVNIGRHMAQAISEARIRNASEDQCIN